MPPIPVPAVIPASTAALTGSIPAIICNLACRSALISGALSRNACPAFFHARSSPISTHNPVCGSSFKNRPGGCRARTSEAIWAAMRAFSTFLVRGSRYSRFSESTALRKRTLPGWELIRPPRPERTSWGWGVRTGPRCPGGTLGTGDSWLSSSRLAAPAGPPASEGGGASALTSASSRGAGDLDEPPMTTLFDFRLLGSVSVGGRDREGRRSSEKMAPARGSCSGRERRSSAQVPRSGFRPRFFVPR
ncbi:hypothetical protein ACHAWF_001662 [Thalassiosira exigua]